jgi:hypothetical protein
VTADHHSRRPWPGAILAVGGLLIAIGLVGGVGLYINHSIGQLVHEALVNDIELEDRADDLRVADLDVRHYHRDLIFNQPTPSRVRAFEERYEQLLAQIDNLERLGVDEPSAPQPAELRAVAEAYFADFRPAIDRFRTDQSAFDEASLDGLERLRRFSNALPGNDEELQAYARFQIISSEYANKNSQVPDADFAKVQEWYLDELTQFVEQYPTSPEAAQALLQLALSPLTPVLHRIAAMQRPDWHGLCVARPRNAYGAMLVGAQGHDKEAVR